MLAFLGEIRGRVLWVVLGCLVCQMGLGYGYAMSGPLAPLLLEEFGWSRALLSSAQVPQVWIIALLSPAVGFLVARYGARPIMATGSVVLGISFLVGAGTVQLWWQFALLWACQGVAVAALGDIAVGTVVSQWTLRSRALALGIALTGSNLGGAVFTRGFAWIAETSSWRTAISALGVVALVVLLPAALFAVRDRGRADVEMGDEVPAAKLRVSAVLSTRSFWLLAFSLFSFWLYLLGVLQHFVLYLIDSGLSRSEAAGHLANVVLMGVLSKVGFGWLADRMTAHRALLLDYAMLATSSILLVFMQGDFLIWCFVLLFGFAYGARDIVTPLIVSWCYDVRYLAQIYGLLMLTFLAGPLGPIIAGGIYDRTGSYQLGFGVIAAFMVLSFVALLFVRDEGERIAA